MTSSYPRWVYPASEEKEGYREKQKERPTRLLSSSLMFHPRTLEPSTVLDRISSPYGVPAETLPMLTGLSHEERTQSPISLKS